MQRLLVVNSLRLMAYFSGCGLAIAGSMGTGLSPVNSLSGLYIGADIGLANLMNHSSHTSNPMSYQLGATGLIGGGMVGYNYPILSELSLAVEGFIDGTGLRSTINSSVYNYKTSQRYNAGVRLLPKYSFTNSTSFHWSFGYASGYFQIQDTGVFGLVNTTYNSNAFQTGPGLSTMVIDNLFLRFDALYNTYAQEKSFGLALPSSGDPFQFYNNQFSQFAGEFSLVYQFG
ncbi:MAG: hypothetical protein A3F18_07155 [Legionellales bacterium RIFCSPHIGHO2_12_FULL_37_14]|nr:MAG: hypothetical protein A3F18_07155 [Legionellales bacterium RIFCSPHIGHO2_12_FULL_37_14]